MAKPVPVHERRTAAVIAMVPLRTREAVERIARQHGQSLSAVARQALEAFVAAEGAAPRGKPRDE